MIASFFDGRVRIRTKILKDPAAMDMARGIIASHDGVGEIVSSLRTGSLLVTYDPGKISREALLAALDFPRLGLQENAAAPKTRTFLSRKAELRLLGGLYGLTVISGFCGGRLHPVSGLLLSLLTVKHFFDRRQSL
jgi:hypothetical protein